MSDKKNKCRKITWDVGRKPLSDTVDFLNEEILEKIVEMRSEGATQGQIAEWLGIGRTSLHHYMNKEGYEKFENAVRHRGKIGFIDNLVGALGKRALGYEYEKEYIELYEENGKKKKVIKRVTEHVPPETNAIKFALSNLDSENWKERRHNELTGSGGGPIEITESPRNKIKDRLAKIAGTPHKEDGGEQE